MGTQERRHREREETRDKILHAARDLFSERGYEAVTMRAVADAIEYTPTAIYHHFENKHALVTELCRSDFERLARHFLRAAAIADPVERIRVVGEAYLDFAERFPNHYRFMFMTALPPVTHGEECVAEHPGNPESDAYAFFRRTCEEAIATGSLRPDLADADELAQILWSALHGLISLHVLKQHEGLPLRDLKTTAGRSMDILFRGMLREAESRG